MKLWFIFLLFLTSCNSLKKAQKDVARVAITHKEVLVGFCADEFPVKDSIIKDTVTTTDTVLIQGGVIEDTVLINDTVRITIVKTLPAKVITNTVHIRDTIIKEGGKTAAQLRSCEIDKSKTIDLLVKKTAESDKYKGQAKKRGWIMWGLILLIALVVGLNIYLRTKKIIK